MLLALRIIMPLGLVTQIPWWFPNLIYGYDFDSFWILYMTGLLATQDSTDLFSWISFYSIMNLVLLATFVAGTALSFSLKPSQAKVIYVSDPQPSVPPGINH
jgi:hypothetical protein